MYELGLWRELGIDLVLFIHYLQALKCLADFPWDATDVVPREIQRGQVGQAGEIAAEVDAAEKVPGKVPKWRRRNYKLKCQFNESRSNKAKHTGVFHLNLPEGSEVKSIVRTKVIWYMHILELISAYRNNLFLQV